MHKEEKTCKTILNRCISALNGSDPILKTTKTIRLGKYNPSGKILHKESQSQRIPVFFKMYVLEDRYCGCCWNSSFALLVTAFKISRWRM